MANIIDKQILDELTGTMDLLVRFQKPIAAPAFNATFQPAEWYAFSLQGNRLSDNWGHQGRMLSETEINELMSMIPENEDEFWAQYADRYSLPAAQFNTDPRILCAPAQAIIGGAAIPEQVNAFVEKYIAERK